MPEYSKVKGSKGVGNAKGSPGKLPKSKPASVDFCGLKDSRPEESDKRQSAR